MPLEKFQKDGKWGLKNSSDRVIVEAQFDEVYLTENAVVTFHYELDEDDEEKRVVLALDLSGDVILDISKTLLNEENIENVLELWQLKDNLFGFQYSNWDSMELTGVFNEKGKIIIKPEYDDIEMISDFLMLCFNGGHYAEYDDLGNKNYGNKLFNIHGQKLEEESISEFEELENGDISFTTVSERCFTLNKFGKLMI